MSKENLINNKNSRLYIYKAMTGVHAGAGDNIGFIDKPIQRESATEFPMVENSSFKGAINEQYASRLDDASLYFGDCQKTGELAFTDLKILFFPVACSKDIFAYVTCPYVIERFCEEAEIFDLHNLGIDQLKDIRPAEHKCYSLDNNLTVEIITLAEYKFEVECKNIVFENKKIEELKSRIIIVHDNIFSDFVKYNTEIITRNRINQDTGTALEKGLFTEEYLPAETILYNFIRLFRAINAEKKLELSDFASSFKNTFYIGGNKTLGKGILKIM